jgi:hypothetical protein
VSLWVFAEVVELRSKRAHGFDTGIWQLIAFVGRYGSTPADVALKMPVGDLRQLSKAVGKILREEESATPER